MPPPGVLELSPSRRGAICALCREGLSMRQIAQKAKVAVSTVHYTLKHDENFHTRHSLPRSGRPSTLTDRKKRMVLRGIRNNRQAPYKEVAAAVGDISEHQVRQIATEAGYHRHVAWRKPFLSKAAIKKRLAWAKENKMRNWRTVIFTDETRLELGERPGLVYVTCKPGEEFLPQNIQPTFRSGQKSIMLWGCVAEGHKGPLIRLDLGEDSTEEGHQGRARSRAGGLNGEQYVKQVLEGPLLEFYTTLNKERDGHVLVVEDGAPAHTSKAANKARRHLGIRTLTHPPNSPDLNPIEPLWALLKTRVAARRGSQKSLDALWKAAQAVWAEMSEEEMDEAMGSMSERVQAVLKAKGGYTPF